MTDTLSVTTVVPTRNRRTQLLTSLSHRRGPVIVVDNGSDDGSPESVASAFPAVRVVRLPENLGAIARNIGVRLARTPYVAFTDDDAWWAPGALERAAELLEAHPDLALVAARVLVGPERRLHPACAQLAGSGSDPSGADPGRLTVLAGAGRAVLGFTACGAVVRREAFLEVGGFRQLIDVAGEEERLALDLAAAGWQLAYVPTVVCHHHPVGHTDDRARRRRDVRDAVVTAVMRRPWQVVVRRVRSAASSLDGMLGLVDALPRIPTAVLGRRMIPDHLEQRCRMLGL